MPLSFFNITDAHNAMNNLSQEQALYWAKVANTEYDRLAKISGSEVMNQRKSIKKANDIVKGKYGTKKA